MMIEQGDLQECVVKKTKRPWRHRIRREAANKRKQLERETEATSELADNVQSSTSTFQKNKKTKLVTKDTDKLGLLAKTDETPAEKLIAARFRFINEQLYTQLAREAQQIFLDDISSFEAYHKGYRKQLEKWPLNPLDFIICDLASLTDGTVVADMGCGEARIASELGKRLRVHSFDLIALNKHVTACNITHTPLQNASVDVVVYCLSLMGANLSDFFREANRILKPNGTLKIAEVTSRFRNVKTFSHAVEQMGFELKNRRNLTEYFSVLTFSKVGKVKQKRPTGLILNPCLYKKR